MDFEDHFSRQAQAYAKHRPRYPAALFAYLAAIAPGNRLAWDCGTGSGQAAVSLAEHFARVIATDASAEQIASARRHERVRYEVCPAEHTDLASCSVDVVTVAQALHWFDLDSFYAGARRVLRPGGVLAAWCYHLTVIEPAVDRVLARYYNEVVGPYWSPRVRLVNEHYRTIAFPFEELEPPAFTGETLWSLSDVVGYLDSWSSTQRFAEGRGYHPVDEIRRELSEAWGEPQSRRLVRWPLYIRVGRAPANLAGRQAPGDARAQL
jgi:SAM-dependent methyltransferase